MSIYQNNNSIKVARVIADLQYGIPVTLYNKKKKILVVPVERINGELFAKLKTLLPDMYLIITKQRASFLLKGRYDNNCKINCKNMTYDDVQDIALSLKFNKGHIHYVASTQLEDQALTLLKSAELIPAMLVAELTSNFKMDFSINNLDVRHINDYLLCIDNEVEEICSADLKLKLAKGKIKAFRSGFGKDHYAIIIYSKKTNLTTPLVRVHSSCFTGDILASIKCDCLDQLQNAIKIMSEKDGGIVLYLNQEGRGVGLTNKIRVYKGQSLGFDTVEANENLGLERDSRKFAIATKILKLLGINKIKLLSNNPAKAKELIKGGVNVESVISHQYLNKEVKDYYRVKAEKLNHKIDYK